MNKMIFEQVGHNEWCYKESKSLHNILNALSAAEDLKDDGYLEEALAEFRKIIKKVPECIEAYNDLYLCHLYLQHDFEAFSVIESAVDLFLPLIPRKFLDEVHCLPWVFFENRPFMRLYANLGLEYVKKKRFAEAKIIFDRLLTWNPYDNQGIRENVILCHIELGLLNDALKVCHCYPEDSLPGLLYGTPLLYIMLNKLNEAKEALKIAIECSPKIAKELLRPTHKPPKVLREDFITLGGDDEACLYWKDYGKFWNETPAALDLLKELSK